MDVINIKGATITINVSDLNTSIAFYTAIGLGLHQRWDNHYAEMNTVDLKIGLHPVGDITKVKGSGSVSIGFTCDDFEKTKSLLLEKSIPCTERQEEGGQFIHFHDPDGTALYFIEPRW